MVEDDGMARHFALKAKERAEQCYSIKSVAARYVNLYESLLARHDKLFLLNEQVIRICVAGRYRHQWG